MLSCGTRTGTNTNPNGTEANAAGRSGNARALRKQSKCGMIQEGEGRGAKKKNPCTDRLFPKMGECREVLGGGPAPPSKL